MTASVGVNAERNSRGSPLSGYKRRTGGTAIKRSRRGWTLLLCTGLLFFYEQNLLYLLLNPVSADANTFVFSRTGVIAERAAWYGVYGLLFALYATATLSINRALAASWPLLILISVVIVSALWSVQPSVSALRGAALVPSTLLGVYLATRLDFDEFVRVVAASLRLSLLISLFFVFALPSLGVSAPPHDGAWRGIFAHRNTLGVMCLLNSVVLVTQWLRPFGARRWMLYADAALTGALLYGSGSKTPLVVIAAMLAVLSLALSARRGAHYFLPHVTIVALSSALVIGNFDTVLEFLGRDTTLSGRALLWQTIWRAIEAQPILGYGFDAFWSNAQGPARLVWQIIGWQPTEAHSLYLDIWLGVGLLGVVSFSMVLLIAFWQAWAQLPKVSREQAAWSICFLFATGMLAFVESYLFSPSVVTWPLFVATTVRLTQTRKATPAQPSGQAPRTLSRQSTRALTPARGY